MKRSKMVLPTRYKITLLIFFSFWLASTLIAPFTIPSHSVDDLTGKASWLDNEKVWERMNPFAAAIYLAGDICCTEIAGHSYYLNDNQMPFCARCTGIFAGLVIGMLLAITYNSKFNWLLVTSMVLPLIVDGGLQAVTSYQSTNPLRALTGMLAGMAVSLYLSHLANTVLIPQRTTPKHSQ